MSWNLCSTTCPCGYTARLSDLRGKPVEFYRLGKYAPYMGVKFECRCGTAYFLFWRRIDRYWHEDHIKSGEWKQEELTAGNLKILNDQAGRFALERHDGTVEQIGCFALDLAPYDPKKVITDDALDVQWVWK